MPNTPNLVYACIVLLWGQLSLSLSSSLLLLTKGGEKVKNFDPLGVVSFPSLCLPSFPSPPSSSDLSLPSKELLRGPLKGRRPGLTVTMTKLWPTTMRSNGGLCAEAHMVTCHGVGPGVEESPVLKVDSHGAHVRGTKESWGDQKAGWLNLVAYIAEVPKCRGDQTTQKAARGRNLKN